MRYVLWTLLILILLLQTSIAIFNFSPFNIAKDPIKVGILFSLTGSRSEIETPAQKATLLAIDQINSKGGVLGRKLIPVIVDLQSNPEQAHVLAHYLLKNENVKIIFGGWNDGDNQKLNQIAQNYNALIFKPFPTEGVIEYNNIIFLGTTGNQQVPISLNYSFNHYGNKFVVLNSNSMRSQVLNIMIKDHLKAKNGNLLADFDFNSEKIEDIISKILELKPSVILNNLEIEESKIFLKKLKEKESKVLETPIISFFLTEINLQQSTEQEFVGTYTAWNYFQSIDNPLNHEFIEQYKKFTGNSIVDNATESAYASVFIWKIASEESNSLDPQVITKILDNLSWQGPEGYITMSMNGTYAWRYMRIGKVNEKGQFDPIVYESAEQIRPLPLLIIRTQGEWKKIIFNLNKKLKSKRKP